MTKDGQKYVKVNVEAIELNYIQQTTTNISKNF